MPIRDRDVFPPFLSGLPLPRDVEVAHPPRNLEGGSAGVAGVGRIVERRVPERHDGVAHVLVDGAAALEDDVGERRQQVVDELRQLVGGQLFRDRGEVPHVAEQQRELAHLAAELEPLGMGDQLVDHGRRDVVRESEAHLAALLLDAPVDVERRQGDEQPDRQSRIGRVEEEMKVVVGEPPADEDRNDDRAAEERGSAGR